MLKNKWLVLSLLAGLIICVGLLVSLFSDGILQRMLILNLEKARQERHTHSGLVSITR